MRISDWSSDVCSSDLNAAKYGAIRAPAGEIAVHWRREQRDGQDWLEIEWRESGVEIAPEPNRRKGFGTELITRRVPYAWKGRGELKLKASGIICVIGFPLKLGASVLQTDHTGQASGRAGKRH